MDKTLKAFIDSLFANSSFDNLMSPIDKLSNSELVTKELNDIIEIEVQIKNTNKAIYRTIKDIELLSMCKRLEKLNAEVINKYIELFINDNTQLQDMLKIAVKEYNKLKENNTNNTNLINNIIKLYKISDEECLKFIGTLINNSN